MALPDAIYCHATWSLGSVVKTVLPTIKRQSLKSLPRHLMILLKRFDFDYEVMQQVKINDRLEFPMQVRGSMDSDLISPASSCPHRV